MQEIINSDLTRLQDFVQEDCFIIGRCSLCSHFSLPSLSRSILLRFNARVKRTANQLED